MTADRSSREPARRCTRLRGDDGAGLVSTLVGFLVFLVVLLFSCQVLLGLFARSTLGAATFDGARLVAEGGADPAGQRRAELEAEARMRQLLGPAGADATFDWSGTGPEWVELRATMPAPRLGWPGFGHAPTRVERGVRVRVEALR